MFMKKLKSSEAEDFFLFSQVETPEYMRCLEEQRNCLEPSETETFESL